MIANHRSIGHIKGWFGWFDFQLFRAVLGGQVESEPGDLVELGTYLGKSAVVIGDFVRPGEKFVVVDLFDTPPDADNFANLAEVSSHYSTLTQDKFEENYRTVHSNLPTIIRGPSSEVMNHVAPNSVRFCHIDASHLYNHVLEDAENARRMLRPGGMLVFDDFRSKHTPGVAAVAWSMVSTAGLIPIALTAQKMYAVFSEPDAAREPILAQARDLDLRWEEQEIAGHPVIRIATGKRKRTAARVGADRRSPETRNITDESAAAIEQTETSTIHSYPISQRAIDLQELRNLISAELDARLERTIRDVVAGELAKERGAHG